MTPRAIAGAIASSLLAAAGMANANVGTDTVPPDILKQYTSRGISADAIREGIANGIYPDVKKYPVPADVSRFKQPASLVKAMKAIQTGTLEQRLEALKAKALDDLVFVKGGTFLMGDFGPLQSKEHLPWDNNANSRPLHTVTLTGYSISKYKVTRAEADLYAEANDIEQLDATTKSSGRAIRRKTSLPSSPISATWSQAKAYCSWLGKLTGKPFSLPTEAQWEYAARSRGEFILYATGNGKYEPNRNSPTSDLTKQFSNPWHNMRLPIASPVGLFPANNLGMHGMTGNNYEWVGDWYASDYYTHSQGANNPRGPSTGTDKIVRAGGTPYSTTIHRHHGPENVSGPTFRCVVDEASQLK